VWAVSLWGRWWVFAAMLSMAAFFAWGSVGMALQWPGFRPEPELDEDDDEAAAD
jgi:hypothetical protein